MLSSVQGKLKRISELHITPLANSKDGHESISWRISVRKFLKHAISDQITWSSSEDIAFDHFGVRCPSCLIYSYVLLLLKNISLSFCFIFFWTFKRMFLLSVFENVYKRRQSHRANPATKEAMLRAVIEFKIRLIKLEIPYVKFHTLNVLLT